MTRSSTNWLIICGSVSTEINQINKQQNCLGLHPTHWANTYYQDPEPQTKLFEILICTCASDVSLWNNCLSLTVLSIIFWCDTSLCKANSLRVCRVTKNPPFPERRHEEHEEKADVSVCVSQAVMQSVCCVCLCVSRCMGVCFCLY